MLRNGSAAAEELGFAVGPLRLIVLEDTAEVHNVIVCTLCSCYPRMLLGLPPAWCKSRNYRSRVVREPRKVLQEFGTHVPDEVEIRVHDATADMRYMVLPLRPAGTGHLREEQLAQMATRDSLIGVALPSAPRRPSDPRRRPQSFLCTTANRRRASKRGEAFSFSRITNFDCTKACFYG